MSKEPIDIDKLFKKALENAPMTPPPGAFSAIKSQLPSLATTAAIGTKVAVSFKLLGVIASTLIVAGTTVYFMTDNTVAPSTARSTNNALELPAIDKKAASVAPILSGEAQSNASSLKPHNTGMGNKNPAELAKIEGGAESSNLTPMGNRGNLIQQPNSPANPAAVSQGLLNNATGEALALNTARGTITQTPTRSEIITPKEAVSKASQEKKRGAILNGNALNCRSRFEIDLSEPVHGAHDLAFKVQGEFGRYEWGLGSQVLGTWTAREGRVNRPIYVKKSQELHFWIRAHFLDGCKDTQVVVRWISPKNYEIPDVFPSVFTPNNDGYNDSFYVAMSEPEFFEITVMDMRGNRVFTSKNIYEKWSGKVGDRVCPSGIYQVYLTRRYSHETDTEKRNFKLELR